MSSLPPSQTVVPGEEEFVHSFNNYLTSNVLGADGMCQKPDGADAVVSKRDVVQATKKLAVQ